MQRQLILGFLTIWIVGIQFLNTDDKRRFDSMKNKNSKKQFLLGRILLRYSATKIGHPKIPIQYYNPTFHEVVFDGTCYYKSISHSNECAIVVVSSIAGKLGIDIETIKERDFRGIASAYFCRQEREVLQKSNFSSKLFYQLWTAKEAYIKAEAEKMLITLKLDFSNVLSKKSRNHNVLCYQLSCYQHHIDNKIVSIMAEHSSFLFDGLPIYINELSAPDKSCD